MALGHSKAPTFAKPKLYVTTTIREQRTCLLSADQIQTSLELTVTFLNRAVYPLILSRNSVQSSVLLAHTLAGANDKRFEWSARGDLWDFMPELQGDSPSEKWVILKPAEAYNREMKAWGLGPMTRREYQHYEATVHFIRLEFITVDALLVARQNKDGTVSLSKKELNRSLEELRSSLA
jgi:hypothetical protein